MQIIMKPHIVSRPRRLIGNFIFRLLYRQSSTAPATSKISSGVHHLSRGNKEEERRNVKVFVWWDIENCAPPVGSNVRRISQNITDAIRSIGIKGPVHINAFGDVLQLSRSNQLALSATGIVLTHVPQGGKNSADISLRMNLMHWVSHNPPPAHLLLISGDTDFANILHQLRMKNYNILLASQNGDASGILCSAASVMWNWKALAKGGNLSGKHLNKPPDGPYNSWYDLCRIPIESVPGKACHLHPNELSKVNSEAKSRSVPKAVVYKICDIVNSKPQGISISELCTELGKSNLVNEKDWYGYKKFSRFLLSMPHILKLEQEGNGSYRVHGVGLKISEAGESSSSKSNVEKAVSKMQKK